MPFDKELDGVTYKLQNFEPGLNFSTLVSKFEQLGVNRGFSVGKRWGDLEVKIINYDEVDISDKFLKKFGLWVTGIQFKLWTDVLNDPKPKYYDGRRLVSVLIFSSPERRFEIRYTQMM